MEPQKPTIGRIVHYYLGDVRHAGPDGMVTRPVYRPAMVANVFDPGSTTVQLQVFVDGSNDRNVETGAGNIAISTDEAARGLAWRTSVHEGETVGTWRWLARS